MQRGILKELAETPVVDAVKKVRTMNELIFSSLENGDIGTNFLFLHNALCIAYATEEKSRQDYIKKMRDQRDAKYTQ